MAFNTAKKGIIARHLIDYALKFYEENKENSQFLRALKENGKNGKRRKCILRGRRVLSCLEEKWSLSEDQRREETEAEFNDFHSWISRNNPSWAESWSKLIDLSEKLEEFNIFKTYKQKMKIFLAAPGIKNESQ